MNCSIEDIRKHESPNEVWKVDKDGRGTQLISVSYEDGRWFECDGRSHTLPMSLDDWDQVKAHLEEVAKH